MCDKFFLIQEHARVSFSAILFQGFARLNRSLKKLFSFLLDLEINQYFPY